MRYVPYDPAKICTPDWKAKADAALKCVETAPPDKRADEINKYRDLWACLKPELAKVMHGKCWYTEAPQTGTDTDVDHFRPKNAVKDVRRPDTNELHPGYWWRAFDSTNYRYSCIVANRRRRDIETGNVGGKADEFPIWREERRAWCPTDSCDDEQPLLIDPCNAAEVAYITFAENGEATPRYSETDKRRLFRMAEESIKLYHLNHSEFVRERTRIRDQVQRHIEDARRYYRQLDSENANVDHAYKRAIEDLRAACSKSAPFSSFAVAMLQRHRFDESLAPVFC
jgi:hypothetical protein